jgi:hypothetical protein
MGVSIDPGPVYGLKMVTLGLPEFAGMVMPAGSLVACFSVGALEAALDESESESVA